MMMAASVDRPMLSGDQGYTGGMNRDTPAHRWRGAIAPTEATWAALMVLDTACLRDGVPDTLVSNRGGAYTSNAFEAVCTRLQVRHETVVSTQGESDQNLTETHVNIQRRWYDDQFSLARTPAAW
jgi:hypothetical protein